MTIAEPTTREIHDWCQRWLGSTPARILFRHRHLSVVLGLELKDGRSLVVKARPHAARIRGCFQVHRLVWEAGFPCAEPLVPPTRLGQLTATAESLLPAGASLCAAANTPVLFAEAFASLVSTIRPLKNIPSLDPPPAWVWWDHPERGVWPLPDDLDVDLNSIQEPSWLDHAAADVRELLTRSVLAEIAGHADFEDANVKWKGQKLHAVHDWDSVATRPEAALTGAAAAMLPGVNGPGLATVGETQQFLDTYQSLRENWNQKEREIAWAAGIWTRAFNAKKDYALGGLMTSEVLAADIQQRLRRAGV